MAKAVVRFGGLGNLGCLGVGSMMFSGLCLPGRNDGWRNVGYDGDNGYGCGEIHDDELICVGFLREKCSGVGSIGR